VDSMFRGSRAPWGRSEDRCDGDGSEADGARPPVKPGQKVPVLGVLVFGDISDLVHPPSSGLRIDKARRSPGRPCPALHMPFAVAAVTVLPALDTPMAWRREGPERREKFFIQSLLRRALLVGRGGLAAAVWSGCNARAG
jgi:hypothetical protein